MYVVEYGARREEKQTTGTPDVIAYMGRCSSTPRNMTQHAYETLPWRTAPLSRRRRRQHVSGQREQKVGRQRDTYGD